MPMEEKKSNQATGAPRLKFRSRTSSSESTREFSKSQQETGARELKPNRKWWEKIFSRQELKETCSFITRIEKKTCNTRTIIHEQDISVFAEEVGNVCNQRKIHNGRIQNQCIDMENVYDFVDESRHSSWAEFQVEFENYKNTQFEDIESVFNITQKMVREHSERNSECEVRGVFIAFLGEIGISQWSSDQKSEGKSMCPRWFRSMCWTDERHSWSDRKMERSIGRTQVVNRLTQDAVGIDGEAIEFEWTNFPGFSTLSILKEIQKELTRKNIQPEEFKDRIIFMPMFNVIDWPKRKKDENCILNAEKLKDYLKRFLQGQWTFLGPGSEKMWYGGSSYPPDGEWDSTADKMVQRFQETRHTVFKSISALSRGILKRKKGKDTIHFNGESSNTELLFRNSSFCKSAQYLRSCDELVWTISAWQRKKRDDKSWDPRTTVHWHVRYETRDATGVEKASWSPNPWQQHHHKARDKLRSATKGERWQEKNFDMGPVAEWWSLSNISTCSQLDTRMDQIFRLHRALRYQPQRTVMAKRMICQSDSSAKSWLEQASGIIMEATWG